MDDQNHLLYAALGNSSFVGVADIDTLQLRGLIEVSSCPWSVAVDSKRGRGYSLSFDNNILTVIDLNKAKALLAE